MKIHLVLAKFIHADGQTEGRTDRRDWADSCS